MSSPDGILLVCMPFGGVFAPSIGLSLLKAELAAEGIPARVRYFSIRFAELVGQDFYYKLSTEGTPSVETLAGEWIFSRALFGPRAENEPYVDRILRKRTLEKPASPALIERILRARGKVDGFIDWCLDEVLRTRPKVLGFSSMFQQHVASLALARLVKRSCPETFVVFGGANCEDVMGAETVRQFPFVDAAVSGEADLVFPELVRRVLEGRPVSGLPGVRTQDSLEAELASGRLSHGPLVRDLDRLPYPDYSDYFREFEASRYGRAWQPRIYLETSRGCWWGERSQCTFCGLAPGSMAFRSKSASRAMDELVWLTRRHRGCLIEATDNILDMRYFRDFVPELASRRPDVRLFYEVKANLRKEQLRLLRAAGIRYVQPGIESFSDPVLKLVRKGVSALQNIQLLKWCKELGVEPTWNLLWGFPGEPPEEYARMAELLPLLTHLPPPGGCGVMRLDRFSPCFEEAEGLGFVDVKPLPSYRHVYALPADALARLASFFTFDYRDGRDVRGYAAGLEKKVQAWSRQFESHDLFSVDRGGWLLLWDLRPVSRVPLTALHGVDRALYAACDSACDVRRLAGSVVDESRPPDLARRSRAATRAASSGRPDGERWLALPGARDPPGQVFAARSRRRAVLCSRPGSREEGPRRVGYFTGPRGRQQEEVRIEATGTPSRTVP